MTYVVQALVGIAAALLAMIVTPGLQHYFWTRQRQAERQLAIIDEVRRLAAELDFLLRYKPEAIVDRQERLHTAFYRAAASVEGLFSEAAIQRFIAVLEPMDRVMRSQEPSQREERSELGQQLAAALLDVVTALYHDVGIPAPTLGRWLRAQVWQPLKARARHHSQRDWRERWRATLRHWWT